jgi:hypothetical protein
MQAEIYDELFLESAADMADQDIARRIGILENKSDSLKEKADKLGDAAKTAAESLVEIKNDLKWHRNIGWTIAGLLGTAFVLLLTFYIPDKLKDELPSEFKERFAKLEQKIDNVQDRINRLTPATLNELIPTSNTSGSQNTVTAQLKRASRVIDVALTSRIPADPQSLEPLHGRISDLLDRYKKNETVRAAAISTDVRLHGYQIASRQLLDGLKPITTTPSEASRKSPHSYLMNFTINCTHPTAYFLGIYPPVDPSGVVVVNVQVNTCAQKLDGPKWINDGFNGSRLEYHGGELNLADVSFHNCKFDFGDDPKSKRVLALITASKGAPVSLQISN